MDQNDQMAFFYEIFDASLPRLGPGDPRLTKKALDTLLSARRHTNDVRTSGKLRVLDIGCGNGGATLELAEHLEGTIVAVDNHQPFLDELRRRAEARGVAEKIEPRLADMRHLDMDDGSFDLVWSEGALSIMGLAEGLAVCRRLLVPGGLLGISDIAWLRPDPPVECREYLAAQCPMMADVDATLALIDRSGYEVLDHFVLPESAWWRSYYDPLEARLRALREPCADDVQKMAMIEHIQEEIELYRKYSDYYGYVFYLMQRR